MKIQILILVIASLLLGCKNAQQNSSAAGEMAESNERWDQQKSENGDYILYQDKQDVQNPMLKRDFFIENTSGEKLYEGSIVGGYVQWYDNAKIEFFSPPGVMPEGATKDDYVMIYDLDTKTTYKKSTLNK